MKKKVCASVIFALATIFIVSHPAFAQYDYGSTPSSPTSNPSVPEFGTMAFLVLVVAIMILVVFTERTRLSRL